jgi:hypothetical protein
MVRQAAAGLSQAVEQLAKFGWDGDVLRLALLRTALEGEAQPIAFSLHAMSSTQAAPKMAPLHCTKASPISSPRRHVMAMRQGME